MAAPIGKVSSQLRDSIAEVLRLACHSADGIQMNLVSPKDMKHFFQVCHNGYWEAQHRILNNILELEVCEKEHGDQLKAARKLQEKATENRIKKEINEIQNRILVWRKLEDSIAWQLLGFQLPYARRFYTDKPPGPISATNYKSVLESANQRCRNDPYQFALMTDLTSFVQVGDLLVIDHNPSAPGLTIIEVKEGRKNEQMLNFLQFAIKSELKCERSVQYFVEEHGKTGIDHFERIAKQHILMSKVSNHINTGVGYDHDDKTIVHIPEEVVTVKSYGHHILNSFSDSILKGWGIAEIEDCLYIGVYQDERFIPAFSKWLGERPGFHPVNFWLSFFQPLALPIFVRQPLTQECCLRFTTGEATCLFFLDLQGFAKLANKRGLSTNWIPIKKLRKQQISEKSIGKAAMLEDKVLEISKGERKLIVSDGLILRILFHDTMPSSAIDLVEKYLDMNEKEKPDAPPG